jgi:hypothetical protein
MVIGATDGVFCRGGRPHLQNGKKICWGLASNYLSGNIEIQRRQTTQIFAGMEWL